MSRVLAIGDAAPLAGFRLAGVGVIEASSEAEIEAAWRSLPADTGALIVTASVANILARLAPGRPGLLVVSVDAA